LKKTLISISLTGSIFGRYPNTSDSIHRNIQFKANENALVIMNK